MTELTFSQDGKVRELLGRAKIVEALAARIPGDLRQAFADAASGAGDELEDFLDEKRDELAQRIPEDARFLVAKLREFDEQSFELVDFTKEKSGAAGKLAVGAGAALLLDRIEPDQLQGDVGFALDDDDALLLLKVTGNLDGSVELAGTAGVLSAGLNFATGTQQTLGYYFTADRSTYVAAIVPRLGELVVDPSSLAAVVEALDTHGLVRIERAGRSTTTLGLTVGISQQLDELVGGLPAVGGAAGSLKVEYRDEAAFSLVVDRAPDRYVVDFRKTRKRAHSRVLELGLDVRLVGFRNRLVERIARALPEDTALAGLLERLDALTAKLSQQALTKELDKVLKAKWPKAKPAIGFLVGDATADELAGEIRAELRQKIEETLNARVDLLNTGAAAAARTVADRIGGELGLSGEPRTALEQYLGEAVEKAMQAFEAKVDGAVAALIDEADVAALLRPWEFVGNAVADAIEAVSGHADDAVGRVRAAIEKVHARYTRFRQGVLTAVREKMEEELSISIVSEKERTLTNTRTVRHEFRRPDAAAESLYKALWTGDLGEFAALAEAANTSPETVALTGEYVSVAARVAKHALDVSLFGLELGATQLFSETVEVGIDLNGRLVVASSKAELEKRRRRGRETQLINAMWQVDYLRKSVLEAPLLVKLVLTDDSFQSGDEVEEFFGPLERLEAMRVGLSEDVETTLFTSTVREVRQATLTVNVMLRWQQWLELVGAGLDAQPVPDAWVPDAVCAQFLRDAEILAPVYPAAARELMRARPEFSDLLAFLVRFGSIGRRRSAARFVNESPRRLSRVFNPGWRLARAVASLHTGLTTLQANWRTLVRQLPEAGPMDETDLENLRAEIEAVNNAFAHTFGDVLSTGLRLDDPGAVSWLAASTLNLFRTRSDLPNPFLSCTFESERTGRLLFS